MDPLTLAGLFMGGGQLLGGIFGSRTNARNQRAEQRRYNTLRGYVDQNMGPQESPYAQQLMEFMKGMQAPGTQGQNAGQDALMQMLRRNYEAPDMSGATGQFDNTDLFRSLGLQDAQREEQQITGLLGSAGSFGQRFGSGLRQQEMGLRQGMANDTSARNAGIANQSFESAQSRMMQSLGMGMQDRQQFDMQQLQAALGLDSSVSNQSNNYNQMMMQGYGQVGALQGQQQQYNAGLMGMLAGMPVPQQQQSLWPQVMGNIGNQMQNTWLMQQLMGQMGNKGGATYNDSYGPPRP